MRAERVVLDTNVLISAVLQPKGPPRAAVDTIRTAGGVLLFSEPTFDELRTRLARPKFDRYVSREGRALFLAQLDAPLGGQGGHFARGGEDEVGPAHRSFQKRR